MIPHSFLTAWLLTFAAVVFPIFPIGAAHADDGNPLSPAASFAGKFANDKLTVELSESSGAYIGTFTKGDNKFPAKASLTAQTLTGTFSASGSDYPFTATLANDQLIVVVGKTTYALTRASANPLDAGAGASPANTPDQTAPAAPVLGGNDPTFGAFSVLGSTPKGKTLFLKLPGGQTIEDALQQTADELAKVLDAKPTITGAYADSKSKNKGGATFTGKLKGQDIQGTILAGTGADNGSATAIIATTDASADDQSALKDFLPVPPPKMTTHTFPDGSGSVDLPEGWTTPNQSAANGIVVVGPAGQTVAWSIITPIWDPESRGPKMSWQIYQTAMGTYKIQLQQYNQWVENHREHPAILAPPDHPPAEPVPPDADPNDTAEKKNSPLRYCKFCDGPEEVLKVWHPMLEDLGKKYGKPYMSVDKTMAIVPAPVMPGHPHAKAAWVYIAVTGHNGDKMTHYRSMNYLLTNLVEEGQLWDLSLSGMQAPDATFDKDLPVMQAIFNSIHVDLNVTNKENTAAEAAMLKQGRDTFAVMQHNHAVWQDQQARQFADHEEQIAAQEQAVHDSSSDFIEYALGLRDVLDTNTGLMHKVDLFHVDAIVGAENAEAGVPNRFVAIKLRDER